MRKLATMVMVLALVFGLPLATNAKDKHQSKSKPAHKSHRAPGGNNKAFKQQKKQLSQRRKAERKALKHRLKQEDRALKARQSQDRKQARSSGSSDPNAGPYVNSSTGKLPGWSMRG